MSYLNVRYPTGHLEKIPVQPNAPLLRALEAACSKRSFDVQKCKLIYRKKPLDLSVPFRLSGLLNHANVELVISDEQPDNAGSQSEGKPIRVCLRLEDGHRAEWMGSVNTCLWEILESIAASEPKIAQLMTPTEAGLAPTLIYIQQQICGEAFLRSATLSSLGIREGSVLLQLVQRVQTDADLPSSASPQTASTSLPANEAERSSAVVDHAQASQSPPEPAPAPSSTAEATPPIRNHNGESFSLIFPSQTTTQRPTSSSASPFAEPFSIFVSALYDFIKDYLVPTARDFQLYTTPPKVNIPNNSSATLVEANLVPMTKVHLTLPSGPPKAADVLRPEYLASLTTESSAADEIAIKWISKQPSGT
nr:unnamed protein product [Spirometra erinaceieuropaei]